MKNREPERDDRASLLALLAALDASPRSLRRDDCGDYAINGKHGHVYADGSGYLLCVTTGESPRSWTGVKRRLGFGQLRQNGDDEGSLQLDRLPAPHEAAAIRDALGIRKRRTMTSEGLSQLRAARNAANLAFHSRTSI